MTRIQIQTEALKLDPAEREALAQELLLSIEGADSRQLDASWLAESRQRDAAYQADPNRARSVDAALAELERKARA